MPEFGAREVKAPRPVAIVFDYKDLSARRDGEFVPWEIPPPGAQAFDQIVGLTLALAAGDRREVSAPLSELVGEDAIEATGLNRLTRQMALLRLRQMRHVVGSVALCEMTERVGGKKAYRLMAPLSVTVIGRGVVS